MKFTHKTKSYLNKTIFLLIVILFALIAFEPVLKITITESATFKMLSTSILLLILVKFAIYQLSIFSVLFEKNCSESEDS